LAAFSLSKLYVITALGIFFVINELINKALTKTIKLPKMHAVKYYLAFNVLMFISNIKLLYSDIYINEEVYNNIIILYLYNIIAIIVLILKWQVLDIKKTFKYIFISSIFLLISIALDFMGSDIYSFMGSKMKSAFLNPTSPFGFRAGGYAQDANAASLCMVFWFFSTLIFSKSSTLKVIAFIGSMAGYLMSFSKTILIALPIVVIYNYRKYLFKSGLILLLWPVFLGVIIFSSKIVDFILYWFYSPSLYQRIIYWENAFDLFMNNCIFGAGISTSRSIGFIEGLWYQQVHSTYISILVEYGVIGLIFFFLTIYSLFKIDNRYYKSKLFFFVTILTTTDLLVFPYIIFVFVLIPLLLRNQGCRLPIGSFNSTVTPKRGALRVTLKG
jgi:hypothetical protein